MMKQLLDEPSFKHTDFSQPDQSGVRRRADADAVIRRAIEAFPKSVGFVNAYGQTETTSSLTILARTTIVSGYAGEVEFKLRRLNSIGKPLPDVEIKVRDDDNKFLPGEVGEIIIRTPRIMKGYAGRKDDIGARRRMARDRRPRLGGRRRLRFFAGRKDDMIIRGGENIAPAEIETVLMSHPAVEEAAVIGVPSVEWGQIVKAYVVLRPGEKVTAKELIDFCRTRLASFKCPESIEFIDALPKNPLGKILRKELHARL